MRKSLKRIVTGFTAAVTAGSMLLTVSPVHAASIHPTSDTMRREATGANTTHAFVATIDTAASGTLVLTYQATFTNMTFTSGACSGGTVTGVGSVNVMTLTLTTCDPGVILANYTGTNGTVVGSNLVTISGSAGFSDTYGVPLVDSDQVTVTASVDASITFDIDTATTNIETAAPYTVALGSLTTAAVSGSDESAINSIWLDLDTNASGGAVVTVSSTNASLKSAAVPADTIPSASAQMSPGTANYGICVKSATTVTGSATSVAPYNNAICDQTPVGNIVGGVTVSPQAILNTNSLPLSGGRAEIMVDAAISTTTPAHTDYSDILKFIATGTF